MASLYIKDRETAALATELAARLKVTKTDLVRDALQRRKAEIDARPNGDFRSRVEAWRARNPLPPPTGPVADKAFYDGLSVDDDL